MQPGRIRFLSIVVLLHLFVTPILIVKAQQTPLPIRLTNFPRAIRFIIPSLSRVFFVPMEDRAITPVPRLWISDGTLDGTAPIPQSSVCGRVEGIAIAPIVAAFAGHGNILYYPGADCLLWRTDGTPAGTWRIPANFDAYYESAKNIMVIGQRLFFFAPRSNNSGYDLWVADDAPNLGSAINLKQVITACDNAYFPLAPVVFNNQLFFFTFSNGIDCKGGRFWELWKSDGTPTGTQPIASQRFPDTYLMEPSNFMAAGNKMYFTAEHLTSGNILWQSDGTSTGTIPVDSAAKLYANQAAPVGTQLFFVHNQIEKLLNGVFRCTVLLSKTQGADQGGVQPVYSFPPLDKDIYGFSCPQVSNMVAFKNKLYFTYQDNSGVANPLYVSDGTQNGTYKILQPNGLSISAGGLFPAVGLLFFQCNLTQGVELGASDGSGAGTYQIADLNPITVSSYPSNFTWANQRLFFTADDGTNGDQLWVYNYLTERVMLPWVSR